MNDTYYLESILKPLLSNPDDLKIDRIQDEKGILLTLTVNGKDMGRVIGKAGATANALRLLTRQYGVLHDQHISVKINEPVTGRQKSDREMLD